MCELFVLRRAGTRMHVLNNINFLFNVCSMLFFLLFNFDFVFKIKKKKKKKKKTKNKIAKFVKQKY